MNTELIQNIKTALKTKKLDIIDILSLVQTFLQDDYEADDIQYVRLKKVMFNINTLMSYIEDERINY